MSSNGEIIHIKVEVTSKTKKINPAVDVYDGFFVKFPKGKHQVLEESFGPDGCGVANLVKADVAYAKNNLVVLSAVWNGFECATDSIETLLRRVVIAYQNKSSSKVFVSPFAYNEKVNGYYRWENEDAGFLAYHETAGLEFLSESSCDPKKFLNCTNLDIVRNIEWFMEKKTAERSIRAASLQQTKAGEWVVSTTKPWVIPPHEFVERNNIARLKSIIKGPANLRNRPDGKVESSVPDNEEVFIDSCNKAESWVRIQWRNLTGWISSQNLPGLNLQKDCDIFQTRD